MPVGEIPPTVANRPSAATLVAWSLGYTAAILGSGLINAALPLIARDLAISPSQAIWVLNAFQLANTVCILPAAALAESVGYKRVFRTGALIFALASVLGVFVSTFEMMILARTLQGIGCGATLACLGHFVKVAYPPHRMGRGLALNAALVSAASGGGPAIAALVLSVGPWPWVFAIMAAVAGASALLAGRALKDSVPIPRRLDLGSAALNAAVMSLVLLAVQGLAQGERPWLLAAEALLATVLGWIFVRRQLSMPTPMLGVDLLRDPVVALSVVTMVFCFGAQGMAIAALPFFLHLEGGSAARIGLLLTCWPLGGMIVAPIAGRLADRYPIGAIGASGMALFAAGLCLTALAGPAAAPLDLAWRIVLLGMGFALFGPPNSRGILSSAPVHRIGAATGLNAAFRGLSQALGGAVAAVLFGWLASGQATAASTTAVLLSAAAVAALGAGLSLTRLGAATRRDRL